MVRTCGIPWVGREARALPRRPRQSPLLRGAALAALLVTPWLASAVSLGEIRLQSYLNEPFRAEIPVADLRPGDLDILEARLAEEAAFARFGLERGAFLLGLNFSLQPGSSPDRGKIVVSSPDIAREPFFSFLLELKGQRERLIREYTVLLDPNTGKPAPQLAPATAPYIEPESVPAPVAPVVQVPQPEAFQGNAPIVGGGAPTVIPRAKPQASQVIYENQPVLGDGEYGPVRAGETLWGVAAAVRPTEKVTMNQVMWALFSHNESKFDGNIDRLNKGAVLTVPSERAMLDVSPAEATALIATARAAAPAGTQQLQVERPAATPAPAAPTPAPTPQPAYYEEELPAEEPALPEEPALAPPREELNLVSPQAEEAELEALPEEPELEALPEEPLAEEEGYEELPTLPEDDALAQEEESAAEVEQAFAEEGLPADDAVAAPPSPAGTDSGLLKWLLVGLGVLGLGGIAAFFLNRSRREAEPDDAPEEPELPKARVAAAPVAAAASAAADDTQDVTDVADELDTQQFEVPPVAAAPDATDLDATAQFDAPLEFDAPTDAQSGTEGLAELELPESEEIDESEGTLDLGSETVSLELNEDPLSEADFQLAYGLYDEAALLLQRAIEATPDRIELHEKLAETYFAASNAEEFRATAEKLKARNPGEDVWQRIAIMGQQLCPDDGLFSGDLEAGGGAIDLDMGFDEPAGGADNSVEFDLGEDEPAAAAPAHDESTVFEADFGDLDLDEGEDSADETLADLDDLGLDDLEGELDTVAGDADELVAELDDDEFSLSLDDEPEAESGAAVDDGTEKLTLADVDAAAGDELELTLDEAIEPADAEFSLDMDDELSLDEEPAAADELSLVGEETDFSVDGGGAEDSLELTDLPEETDFDVDSGSETGLQDDELDTAFDLPEIDAAAEATDFDLSEVADLSTSELEEDAGPAGELTDFTIDDDAGLGEATDFELGDDSAADLELSLDTPDQPATADSSDVELGDADVSAESTDFDLGEAQSTGEVTDFELDDAAASGEETDFDLGEIGEETDFDLAADDVGEGTDFDLGEIGSDTEFDLGDDSDATALDDLSLADLDDDGSMSLDDSSAADISGGDEPGTKLDLATAYVEMGETDMARNLLNEVLQAGDAEQKAKAQELLDQI